MTRDEIRRELLEVASNAAGRGPGWAQEGVVLRMMSERMSKQGKPDLDAQQAVLEIWHDLFAEKTLAWGYNLDNPSSPFFHLRQSA